MDYGEEAAQVFPESCVVCWVVRVHAGDIHLLCGESGGNPVCGGVLGVVVCLDI